MTEDFFGRYDWDGKCILIVEDDISSIFYLKEILKESGAELLIAEDGATALDFCRENSGINLVLMDIQLPVLNGYEATARIKKIRPELPVIAQTAYAMTDERIRCMESGCIDYISKPLDPFKLLEIIAKYI